MTRHLEAGVFMLDVQQRLARTTPWVGHLLSERRAQTGGLSDRRVDQLMNSLSPETSHAAARLHQHVSSSQHALKPTSVN